MMDFITIPLVVGTITLGIYKLFELFVCKKERIAMIENWLTSSTLEKLTATYLSTLTTPVPGSLSDL